MVKNARTGFAPKSRAASHQREIHLIHRVVARQNHEGNQAVDHRQQHRAIRTEKLDVFLNQPQRAEHAVERAVGLQKDLPAVNTHQRARPERDDDQHHQQGFPLARRARHAVAEGIAHQQGNHRRPERKLQAVGKDLEIILAQQRFVVGKRQRHAPFKLAACDQRRAEHVNQRQSDQQHAECRHRARPSARACAVRAL